jgi:hypothetical protein
VQLREILAIPAIAATLGFLVGVGLIYATAWSRTISTSSDATDSIAIMMLFMMGGMLVASAVLLAFVWLVPKGFVWFGVSLGAGFVIGLGVIAIGMLRETFRDQ